MTTDTMTDVTNVDLYEKPVKIARISNTNVTFEDLSAAFQEASFGQIDFEKQYASDYFIRLEVLRTAAIEAGRRKWMENGQIEDRQVVGHVKDYKSNDNDIVLVGVLFKDMCLKPSVLSDIQNNLKISDQFMNFPSVSEITQKLADTDTLFLEDMEARLQLVFSDKSNVDHLPTGLVVAVLGKVNNQGFFDVHDFVLPGCGIPAPIPVTESTPAYVAMVSGLRIGAPETNSMALQLLKDFLMGVSLSASDRALSSQISRLVISGDSLYVSGERDPTASALSEADVFLAEIASVMPVHLMSGPRDPANYCLPQQPLHSGLFPEARRYNNLTVHSNPSKFKIGSMVLLGSSGQNVTDLIQFTSLESGLDALEVIANSRYLAPTAPDTLACYPFTMKDPLIITDDESGFAHVLFAGNQMSTDSKLIADGKVRLASVADFSVSQSVLLIDVNNISNVRVIEFDMPMMM